MKTASALQLGLGVAAVMALVAPAHPAAAEEAQEKKKIRIEKVVQCEDGDCTDEISVGGEEGQRIVVRKMRCDGEDCPHHEGGHHMVFVGDEGDVEVMRGGGGHRWIHRGAGGSYLGVGLTELTPELRTHFGVASDAGVMVSKVLEDSPAQAAGLAVGDIIVSAGGEPVGSAGSLASRIGALEEGTEVALEVWRNGSPLSINATVAARPGERLAMGAGPGKMRKMIVRCEDGDEDCEVEVDRAGFEDFDCGAPDCRVTVECEDGDCTCQVNGEDADCSGIPGVPSP